MSHKFFAACVITLWAMLIPNGSAQAKNTCVALYKRFAQHQALHKAFATTGGVPVNSKYPYSCGFASDASKIHARQVALKSCAIARNRNFDIRQCDIITEK